MIVVNNHRQRTVYAEELEDGHGFLLSTYPEAKGSRRPSLRFGTLEEIEAYLKDRNCEVQWLAR